MKYRRSTRITHVHVPGNFLCFIGIVSAFCPQHSRSHPTFAFAPRLPRESVRLARRIGAKASASHRRNLRLPSYREQRLSTPGIPPPRSSCLLSRAGRGSVLRRSSSASRLPGFAALYLVDNDRQRPRPPPSARAQLDNQGDRLYPGWRPCRVLSVAGHCRGVGSSG